MALPAPGRRHYPPRRMQRVSLLARLRSSSLPWLASLLFAPLLQAGIAWTPVGHPTSPAYNVTHPSNPLITWTAGPDMLLNDAGFEGGLTNAWRVETLRGNGFVANYAGAPGLEGIPVLEGRVSACLPGGKSSDSESVIYQDVTLPADSTSATVSWTVWTDDLSAGYPRALRLEVRDLANRVHAVIFRADQGALPYRMKWSYSGDLSKFAGQTVRLAFVATVRPLARLQIDDVRLVLAPIAGVEFEIYQVASWQGGESNLLQRTRELHWQPSDLQPGRHNYFGIVTVRENERVAAPPWSFRTAARGGFERFGVKSVGSPQFQGRTVEFEARALDGRNFEPTDAPPAGTAGVMVAAVGLQPAPPTVVISEVVFATAGWVGRPTTNAIECANVSTNSVDVSGWKIVLYDGQNYPSPRALFTAPSNTVVLPGETFVLWTRGKPPGTFPNFNVAEMLDWDLAPDYRSRIGAGLLDAAGVLVDFVPIYRVEPSEITQPVRVGLEHWCGAAFATVRSTSPSFQRVGHADNQTTNDWVASTNTLGKWNPGLHAQFLAGPGKLCSVPQAFTNELTGSWTGEIPLTEAGTNVSLWARDARGRFGQSEFFDIKSHPLVTVEMPGQVREGDPANAGVLRLREPVGTNVVVRLFAEPGAELLLPAQVEIPAGETAITFSVQANNDSTVDGPAAVLVTGEAAGFEVTPQRLQVLDDESAVVTLVLPEQIAEGATGEGTVFLSVPAVRETLVRLVSNDPAVLQVPANVMIPAGASTASFAARAVEDDILAGARVIAVMAQVAGWTEAEAGLTVTDNEARTLTLSFPSRVFEGSGTNSGSVTVSGRVEADLVVNLASSDESELRVPATVVIPAGKTNALIAVQIVEDAEKDGTQEVRVDATSQTFLDGFAVLQVGDNDPHHFVATLNSEAKLAGIGFPVTVTAFDVNGEKLTAYSGDAAVAGSGSGGALAVSPARTGNFVNGVWSGFVTVGEPEASARLRFEAPGAASESPPFRVLPNPIRHELSLQVADLVWNRAMNRLLASVSETDPAYSNSVVTIRPDTGTIERVLPVGRIQRLPPLDATGEGRMALSVDGRTLYVGIESATQIQQFDIKNETLIRQFAVGTHYEGGPTVAYDFQVTPNEPDRIVLARPDAYNGGSLRVYDKGEMLPEIGPWSSHVMLAPDGTNGFSYHGRALADNVFRYQVHSNGISGTEMLPHPYIWFGGDVQYSEGLIYFSSGHVYDPAMGTLVARYPLVGQVNSYDNQGRFAFSADGQWIWFISGNGAGGQLLEMFARDTFQLVRRLDLRTIPGPILRFSECGPDWLALHNGSSIYLLQSSLLQPVGEWADLSIRYEPVTLNAAAHRPFTYSIAVTNLGPATATGVILESRFPGGTEPMAGAVSQGSWETNSATTRRAVFGDLPPGGHASATVTLVPRHGGWFTNDLMAVADQWDPVPADNRLRPILSVKLGLGRDQQGFIPIAARGIAFDAVRGRVYASVGTDGGAWANRVVVVDVLSGGVTGALDVGPSPSHLVVTDDGGYLYTAIDNDRAVARVDLQTGKPDMSFVLGRTSDNWLITVRALQAVPGAPRSIAILRLFTLEGTGTSGGGVAIYDGDECRPLVGLNLDYVASGFFRFNEDGTKAYGANHGNADLECFSITPEGVTMDQRMLGILGGQTLAIDYTLGKVYTTNGRVIEPEATNSVLLPVQGQNWGVNYHRWSQRICYLGPYGSPVQVFDAVSGSPAGTIIVTNTSEFLAQSLALPQDQLVFRTQVGGLYFVRSSLLLPPNLDTDGDQLPDAWEVANGLDPDLSNAQGDADGDGASDLDEYIAGTMPKDASHVAKLVLVANGPGILLRIHGVPGRSYQLQRSGDVRSSEWLPASQEQPGANEDLSFEVPHSGAVQQFYRVLISR